MTKPLEKEYAYFLKIQEELAQEHDGRFVAIKGEEVLGIFDNYMAAAGKVYLDHERGTVLMQEISSDRDSLAIVWNTPGITVDHG